MGSNGLDLAYLSMAIEAYGGIVRIENKGDGNYKNHPIDPFVKYSLGIRSKSGGQNYHKP